MWITNMSIVLPLWVALGMAGWWIDYFSAKRKCHEDGTSFFYYRKYLRGDLSLSLVAGPFSLILSSLIHYRRICFYYDSTHDFNLNSIKRSISFLLNYHLAHFLVRETQKEEYMRRMRVKYPEKFENEIRFLNQKNKQNEKRSVV